MLKAQKKLTKRQLKEDKLVTFYFKSQEWLSQNSQKITYGIVGVVAVVVLVLFINRNQAGEEMEGAVALTKARIELSNNNYDTAIAALSSVVSQYSGTEAGAEARFLLANTYFFNKEYDNAEANFREYLNNGSDPVFSSSAYAGIAACHEQKAEYKSAAETYEKGAMKYGNVFTAPENLYHAARCFVLAGDNDSAKKVLTLLLDKYESSGTKEAAELLLAELS